jgi:hypothetical protein
MRIGIISPLFPPDIAIPAPYVKELAMRLAHVHDICVLTYNHIPETIPRVSISAVEKQQRLPLRLYRFTRALSRLAREVDVIIVQNGISTELPALLVSFFRSTPILLETSDPKAILQNKRSFLKRSIHKLLCKRALSCSETNVAIDALTKPEVFSFLPYPTDAFNAYETAWEVHLLALRTNLNLYANTK